MTLWITLISNSFAQNAVYIDQGKPAPYDGVLLTVDRAEEALKAEKSIIVLKDLGIAKDELILYYKQDARVQRRKLSEARFKGFWANTMYFGLGVILTGFAFKVNEKIGDM